MIPTFYSIVHHEWCLDNCWIHCTSCKILTQVAAQKHLTQSYEFLRRYTNWPYCQSFLQGYRHCWCNATNEFQVMDRVLHSGKCHTCNHTLPVSHLCVAKYDWPEAKVCRKACCGYFLMADCIMPRETVLHHAPAFGFLLYVVLDFVLLYCGSSS